MQIPRRVWYNHTMKQQELTTENVLSRLPGPLLEWFRGNARDLPWRRTEDPYPIWVSEIMLQQTRVAAVLGYYARFLTAFPSVEALANAPEDRLMKLWEGLGYYSRARNLQKAAKAVEVILTDGADAAMNRYNKKAAKPKEEKTGTE